MGFREGPPAGGSLSPMHGQLGSSSPVHNGFSLRNPDLYTSPMDSCSVSLLLKIPGAKQAPTSLPVFTTGL